MSARALANIEKQQQAIRMEKLGRSLLLLLATVLSMAAVTLLILDRVYRPDEFVIEQLTIKGKFHHLDPKQIEQLIADEHLGNFFSIDLQGIKRKVEKLPWVQTANVYRKWPNSLLIRVEEHRPVMRWQNKQWVTSYGEVVDLPESVVLKQEINLSGNKKDAKLLLQQAFVWKKKLQQYGLQLKEVSLSGSHAWHLNITNPMLDYQFELLLGRSDIQMRLQRALQLYERKFKQGEQVIERIDARYPDGLVVKAKPKTTNKDKVAIVKINKFNPVIGAQQ